MQIKDRCKLLSREYFHFFADDREGHLRGGRIFLSATTTMEYLPEGTGPAQDSRWPPLVQILHASKWEKEVICLPRAV